MSSILRLILAARNAGLPSKLEQTGFYPMSGEEAILSLEAAGLWYGPRPVLEDTPEFRQIIPYVVVVCGSKIVRYRRTPAGNEGRLHGKISIGLGGHVDIADAVVHGEVFDLRGTIEEAASRELREELGDLQVESKEWIGLLVENESAVGRVHIGLVGIWQVSSAPGGVTEDCIGQVALASVDDLERESDNLELWSSMLLPRLSEELRA